MSISPALSGRMFHVAVLLILASFSGAWAAPVAPVPRTGQTECYAGGVIACAGTGQDGEVRSGIVWPNDRFTDHGDGSVTDTLTGLTWSKDANAPGPADCGTAVTKNWQEALSYAACLNTYSYLGNTDWRVPSIRELESLVDISRSPALPEGHPFTATQTAATAAYWTSTTDPTNISSAFSISIKGGYANINAKSGTNSYNHVWPVRSGNASASAPVPETGQAVGYAAGDDGSLKPGVAWPSPRFTDNGNGTVTDNLTGLVWLKNANCTDPAGGVSKTGGYLTWFEGLSWSTKLASGSCGLSDGSEPGNWRLPNKNELWSLIDHGRANPSLPAGHPFAGVLNAPYLSSSTYVGVSGNAWYVGLDRGALSYLSKGGIGYVWPVRAEKLWSSGPVRISSTMGDLGSTAVNGSRSQEMRIGNDGGGPFAVTSITMTGTDAAEFSVAIGGSNGCHSLTPTLSPGTSCTVIVTFSPASTGAKSATLTVVTDAATATAPLTATAFTTVSGSVIDRSTGLPVSGATVTLSGGQTTGTSTSGAFDFGPLAAGTYSVTVSKAGYQSLVFANQSVSASAAPRIAAWLPTTGVLTMPAQQPVAADLGIAYSYRLRTGGGPIRTAIPSSPGPCRRGSPSTGGPEPSAVLPAPAASEATR